MKFNIYQTNENSKEALLIKNYLEWEGFTSEIITDFLSLRFSKGNDIVGVCVTTDTSSEYIGGFYKVIDYINSKGLRS